MLVRPVVQRSGVRRGSRTGSPGWVGAGARRLAFPDDPPLSRESDEPSLGDWDRGEGEPVGRTRGLDERRVEVIVVVAMPVTGDDGSIRILRFIDVAIHIVRAVVVMGLALVVWMMCEVLVDRGVRDRPRRLGEDRQQHDEGHLCPTRREHDLGG